MMIRKEVTKVIPAQAGMILISDKALIIDVGYPCTSGDDPDISFDELQPLELSLHKRG